VWVVFSDLDGTLLDPEFYDFAPAKPALEALAQQGIPLVLVSSKTRAEMEYWRTQLGNAHPFIVENGGAVYVPRGYFPFALPGAQARGRYEVLELGRPYEELVQVLEQLAAETRTPVRGFHNLPFEELQRYCQLPAELARLALQREYDLPFVVPPDAPLEALLRSIEQRGLRCVRGDRFYHLTGQNDKAAAVQALIDAYQVSYGPLITVGLGDAPNDFEFLHLMDIPILVRSPANTHLKEPPPRARLTSLPGPHGWNQAILALLSGEAAL